MAETMKKTLEIGFSPCPNDTFIFEGLINGKIDAEGYSFIAQMADIEVLNKRAIEYNPLISKISIGAYPKIAHKYKILDAGAALGRGVGPLLVAKKELDFRNSDLLTAIPGINTTANLLLSSLFPHITQKKEYLFSEIAARVKSEEVQAGLLIHEGRFTFQESGLMKLCDLGDEWEAQTGMPIPLGCIVVSRELDSGLCRKLNTWIRRSIEKAFQSSGEVSEYIKVHAQEMDEDVIRQHIKLYVNDYSLDLGAEGREAIKFLFKKGFEAGLLPEITDPIFID